MGKKVLNKNLHSAKDSKKDEFYTQLADIERELTHYKEHLRGKVVFCNCDDPRVSNFFHYFSYNFEQLGLKKLITTCYKNQNPELFTENNSERAIYLEYTGRKNGNNVPQPEEIGIMPLKGDGDFRSKECAELLREADIVVTNPPFSLFREYVAQLVEYDKQFKSSIHSGLRKSPSPCRRFMSVSSRLGTLPPFLFPSVLKKDRSQRVVLAKKVWVLIFVACSNEFFQPQLFEIV